LNNAGQMNRVARNYLANPINPRGSGRTTTPQEAVLNTANALSDPAIVDQLHDLFPNALEVGDNAVTFDFDEAPAEADWFLSGIYDLGDIRSRQSLPKLFKGKVRVQKTSETSEAKQVEVQCPETEPLEITPAISNGAKLKLVGGLKAQIPKASQPDQAAQAQIDYESLKIEDRSQASSTQQKGDTLVLGEAGRSETTAVVLKMAPDDSDNLPSFDIEGMDWNDCPVTWIDDDLLSYLVEGLVAGYLTWLVDSNGFWYIQDDVDDVDCAGFYGADWSYSPLPRSRRQAELLIPFEFIWDDTLDGCGAIDDYQLAFTIDGINYMVETLEDIDYVDWCLETDTEFDSYLAALLNLPPGADLADTVLTAEAWATGLPTFGYLMYELHKSFVNPASGVAIEGDYPRNYTATLTNFTFADSSLTGRLGVQFNQTDNQWEMSVTFMEFNFADVKLAGTLNMHFDEGTGQGSITVSQFSWDIPNESQGSVPNGTMNFVLNFDSSELVEVRTTAFEMRMNVKNLLLTPAQTYSVVLSAAQPLVWPLRDCNFTVEGVLRISGNISGQSIQMDVDFGEDGECGKAIISSGGRSAKYDLENGLFVELTRLRGKTRSYSLPQPRSMRFWLNRSARS